jgi:hypothetical protein
MFDLIFILNICWTKPCLFLSLGPALEDQNIEVIFDRESSQTKKRGNIHHKLRKSVKRTLLETAPYGGRIRQHTDRQHGENITRD